MIVLSPSPLVPAYVFCAPDDLTTTDNGLIPWVPGRGLPISRIRAQVQSEPTGDDLVIDIKVKDAATGANVASLTVTVLDGDLIGATFTTPRVIAEDEVLAMEITQIGSTDPGTTLTVMVD